MEIQIYRINSSSYQGLDFLRREKEALESIPGVTYKENVSDIDSKLPLALISNTHTKTDELPKELISKASLWIHPNSGYDNFSREFAAQASFPIILGNPVRAEAVTEYILGCVFSHFSPIPNQRFWSEERKWSRSLVRDQKILILGYGFIGEKIFKSLSPLCPQTIVVDPYQKKAPYGDKLKKEMTEEDLRDATVVLVAASLTKSSRGMIDKKFLSKISTRALLVNTARGEILKEKDLVDWLRKNEKAKAYLDVFEKEPYSPGHLAEIGNLNKTSHIAGVSKELNADIIAFERTLISEYLHYLRNKDIEGFLRNNQNLLLKANSTNFN